MKKWCKNIQNRLPLAEKQKKVYPENRDSGTETG